MTIDKLLEQYKAQYGSVFAAYIKDDVFIFRQLTRKEHRKLAFSGISQQELDEEVCRITVLFPENYDFSGRGSAGLPQTLAPQIVMASGYAHPSQQAEKLMMYKAEMEQFEFQAEAYISYIFKIPMEEMEDWTQDKLMKYLARAEWVNRELRGPLGGGNERFNLIKQEEQEGPQEEPPTLQEIGKEMREVGLDPMMELASEIRRKPPYAELPIIGGTKLLENEGVLGRVREQIQRLSE